MCFHLNGDTTGFYLQNKKLEPHTVEPLYNGHLGDRRKWLLTSHQDSLRAYALFIIFCIHGFKITVVVTEIQLRIFQTAHKDLPFRRT